MNSAQMLKMEHLLTPGSYFPPILIVACLAVDIVLKWWTERKVAIFRARLEQHRRDTKLQKKLVRQTKDLTKLHPQAVVDEVARIGQKNHLSGNIAQDEQVYRYAHVLLTTISMITALYLVYQSVQ